MTYLRRPGDEGPSASIQFNSRDQKMAGGAWVLRLRAQCVFVRPRTNVRPARRSLLKEAGIATSLGVVVAARRRRVVEVASSERHRRKLSPHTGRLLRLVPDARQSPDEQNKRVLRAEPDDGRGNRAVTSVHAHNILLVDVGRRVPVRPRHIIKSPAVRPS